MRLYRALFTSAVLATLLASCDTSLLGPEGAVVINGVVVDAETKAPIPGAVVTISDLDTSLTTDVQGRFVVSNVAIGSYAVQARADGYRPGQRTIATDIDLFGPDTIALTPNVPGLDLLAYWPLDGNANDVSGSHLDGSASGILWTVDRFSSASSAAQVDGSTGGITVADRVDLGTSDFGATAWIQFSASQPDNPAIVGKMSSTAGFELRVEGRSVAAEVRSSSGSVTTSSIRGLNDGRWHMLAFSVSRSSRQVELYIDGDFVAVNSGAGAAGSVNTTSRLLIGRSALGGSSFAGAIDDVRLFSRSLSSADVRGLYHERGW